MFHQELTLTNVEIFQQFLAQNVCFLPIFFRKIFTSALRTGSGSCLACSKPAVTPAALQSDCSDCSRPGCPMASTLAPLAAAA